MPKATVTLSSGAIVHIEGTTEEVKDLLNYYDGTHTAKQGKPNAPRKASKERSQIQR